MSNQELHLRVYINKSELVRADGTVEVFLEGPQTKETKKRYQKIRDAFEAGFLEKQIELCRNNISQLDFSELTIDQRSLIEAIVVSITGNEGRAFIILTVLQLCVKAIEPTQNIRLHKGGRSSRDFSWKDGISMRSIDNTFITPILRKHNLLKVNADGGMMTRSFAENYPYSLVYKAQMRGARSEWLKLVEQVETTQLKPLVGECQAFCVNGFID